MIQVYAANGPEHIGDGIEDTGISEGNIILMDFIADAVKSCGYHTEQNQHPRVAFDPQSLVCPVKQDAHHEISQKMKHLVAEFKRRNMFRCRKVRLDINREAIYDEW